MVRHSYKGFTLVEFLVSLLVLSIGTLGLAYSVIQGIKTSSVKDKIYQFFLTTSQTIDPLEALLRQDAVAFQTALNAIASASNTTPTPDAPVAVNLVSAVDNVGGNIQITAPSTWAPPLTVKIDVLYHDGTAVLHKVVTQVLVP